MWRHLREEPVEFHAFGRGVAALEEARPAVHVHQALVVVVVSGWTEEPDVELLSAGVVHILQETPHPAYCIVYCTVGSGTAVVDI